VVLLSFGGMGLPGFASEVLEPLAEFRFVIPEPDARAPGNVAAVTGERLEGTGLRYVDLIGAADVVVTKPGYGIVSDAIGAGTRLVYTDRGDFPEYPILVREMARSLPCAYVSHQDLLAGRLEAPLRTVLAAPSLAPPDLGGAAVTPGGCSMPS
jgi:hypothetical protein